MSDFEWTTQALGEVSERMTQLGDHTRIELLELATRMTALGNRIHQEMSQMGETMKGSQGRLTQLDQRSQPSWGRWRRRCRK